MEQANDGSKCKAAKMSSSDETEQGFSITPKLSLDNKERNGGGFLPFSRERNFCTNHPELTLASVNKEIEENKCLGPANGMSSSGKEYCTKGEKEKGTANGAEAQTTTQPQRKSRRCWSPDLHRRFVNALQMLGGSQVATPKQIRELMKVDGLTNDEVKSHLQKYRLHMRRPGPNPPSPATQAPQLVVLGGIWVPPEYAAAHGAIYGAHPASAHYCAPPVPQDFYPGPPHHHYHPYNKASSQTHSSPESGSREAGERSESMEEEGGGKSDSGSWRGRGKEEGMVARGLLSLKDGGEDEGESHGSGITLKF
ncbi:myb family transcription factor EFM-like protein [Cinnamomum micranthum f. kanehirae]|uniref:Myb family transcription factor EFM-like protein n=1 Tax=Cinnamomum micranthum f. kanehirae TaxID=337451 RepID=A0A443Q454_9MAGN|nr:myb family transcription factor EFM-like protein [Cinnamomum micranthum f. kanehirae]